MMKRTKTFMQEPTKVSQPIPPSQVPNPLFIFLNFLVTTLGDFQVHISDSPDNPRFATFVLTICEFLSYAFTFVRHEALAGYYNQYAKHYHLFPSISLNSYVEDVKEESDSTWRLSVVGNFPHGLTGKMQVRFDHVICATGTFVFPNLDVPWMSKYSGCSLHSAYYRYPPFCPPSHL